MAYKKISRTIFRISNLVCKISIGLLSGEGQKVGVDVYDFSGSKYLSLQYYPLLVLDIVDKSVWSRNRSIVLNSKTLVHFISGVHKLIKLFDNDIYFYNSDKKLCLVALDSSYLIRLTNLGDNNIVEMYPVVIEDRDLVQYEGARLVFNNVNNFVELSYDELLSLSYLLKKIDLFTYSQLLINFIAMTNGKSFGNIHYNGGMSSSDTPNVTSTGFGKRNESVFKDLKLKEE